MMNKFYKIAQSIVKETTKDADRVVVGPPKSVDVIGETEVKPIEHPKSSRFLKERNLQQRRFLKKKRQKKGPFSKIFDEASKKIVSHVENEIKICDRISRRLVKSDEVQSQDINKERIEILRKQKENINDRKEGINDRIERLEEQKQPLNRRIKNLSNQIERLKK